MCIWEAGELSVSLASVKWQLLAIEKQTEGTSAKAAPHPSHRGTTTAGCCFLKHQPVGLSVNHFKTTFNQQTLY